MTDRTKDAGKARRARHAAILAEVAHEEATAAQADSAERVGAPDIPTRRSPSPGDVYDDSRPGLPTIT